MIMKLFSVRDTKVDAFLPLIQCRTEAEAVRMFTTALDTTEHQFAKHPADYVLFYIGEWDDNGGVIQSSGPRELMNGLQAKTPLQ